MIQSWFKKKSLLPYFEVAVPLIIVAIMLSMVWAGIAMIYSEPEQKDDLRRLLSLNETYAALTDQIVKLEDANISLLSGGAGLLGVGAAYLLPRRLILSVRVIVWGLLLGHVASVYTLFWVLGLSLNFIYPGLTATFSFTLISMLRLANVEKEEEAIRRVFSPLVGPKVSQELIDNPPKTNVNLAQRRVLTILFCDVVGFTSFCENQSKFESIFQKGYSPEAEIVNQVNEYLAAMTEVVFYWRGTLVDFLGDEVYAFWGAPLDQPNHVELATKCALHMRMRLAALHKKWKAEGRVLLDNGIGLNTGEVLVANLGAKDQRMKYAAVGDHINLASRISGLTRTFSRPIVVSESTAASLKSLVKVADNVHNIGRLGHIGLEKLAAVKVKGRDEPVVVYELKDLDRGKPSKIEEQKEVPTLDMKEK